jgi:hypothetical protein
MSATSPASLNLLTIRSGLEGRNRETAPTEGSAGLRSVPPQVNEPEKTSPDRLPSRSARFPVTGRTRQEFPERKGPNVETRSAAVDFPTDAAPPFTVDGERYKHPKGKHHSVQIPPSRALGYFFKKKEVVIHMQFRVYSYDDFEGEERVS